MRYLVVIALAGFLMTVLAPSAFAVDWLPLVPCGLNPGPDVDPARTQPCNQCDLYKLLKNVIDMILFGITAPIAAALFVFAGLLYIMSGPNPGLASRARNIFTNTFYALLVIGGSWLIVNTLLLSFATENIATEWWKLTCETTVPTGVTPPPVGGVPGQAQAQALLASGVRFSTDADCGNSYHALGTIQAIAQGSYPPVCSPSCSCVPGGTSGNVTVSTAIFGGLLSLKNSGVNFTVTSLTTGRHSVSSSHYTGHAVDIVPASTNRTDWQRVRAFLNSQGGTAMCEDGDTGHDVPDCNAGQVNHIHWTR